jgi:hypothetical protein
MKKVLSQLHNAIIELEDNNLIKEAKILDEVFVKIADSKNDRSKRRNDWYDPQNPYQTETSHEYTPLADRDGNPTNSNDISSYNTKLDIRIRQSPAYSFFQNRYIVAKDNYLKSLNKFKNRDFQTNKKDNDLRKLYKSEFDAAVQDWEDWFVSALIQVKDGQKSPGIPKRFLTKPVVKPQIQTKPKAKVQPETKPVSKPATPQSQVTKPKPVEQKATAPVTTNQTTRKPPLEIGEPEITRRAQEYLDVLKSRVVTEKEKIWQAYAFLQFIVYREDTTTGKLVYRKWQDLVDEYQKERQQQQQQTTTTTPSAPSAPSTTQSNPSTSPTPIKEV